jgi:hypothetical protein
MHDLYDGVAFADEPRFGRGGGIDMRDGAAHGKQSGLVP